MDLYEHAQGVPLQELHKPILHPTRKQQLFPNLSEDVWADPMYGASNVKLLIEVCEHFKIKDRP